jgi:hypothetical protein
MLAIAVFCEDRPLFERALIYYLHGDGDGRLTHYIYENGQCQESGRDQQHTQLGLGHMGDACQIAWNQGLDLYGADANRLLRGFEYTAAYNLGDEVEFRSDIDRTGKYSHKVISPRSTLRPIYEQIFAHYHVRRGLPVPAVERAVAKLRPEGAAQGADHTGFGTLLYALDESDLRQQAVFAAPAALLACSHEGGIQLDWLRPRERYGFRVDRAAGGDSFKMIASGVTDAGYFDTSVHAGTQYRYRVSQEGTPSMRVNSNIAGIVYGLPGGWTHIELGDPKPSGRVQFDGEVLTIFASGIGVLGDSEEGQFVCAQHAKRSLTVRTLPGTASQFVQFGLTCRISHVANAPSTSLVLIAAKGDRERGGWSLRFFTRGAQGDIKVIQDYPLLPPTVEYGRIMRPIWLRLKRRQGELDALYSSDGRAWIQVGSSSETAEGSIGIVASSGIPDVDSAIRFDSLTIDSANA